MTIEEKLKDLILMRYHSIREFTIAIDMPYTTMDSIFRRGIGNSSISNILKICKALGISVDALADGEITFISERPTVRNTNNVDITDIIADTKGTLTQSWKITLDGNPIDKAGVESIIDAMELGVEMVKRKNSL